VSYQVASLAQVLSGGTPILNLAIEDGSTVTVDRANLIRRICSLSLTDPNGTLVASTAKQLLSPLSGNEIAVYYGVVFSDGTQELILLGIFGIVDSNVDDSGGDLAITVDGSDRMRSIQRDVFTDTYSIAPGTDVGVAIQNVVLSRNVSPLAQQFAFEPTGHITPNAPIIYNAGDDPAQAIADLATSVGDELFYSPNGWLMLLPIPDPTTQPITWTYDGDSVPNTNIATDIQRTVSSDTVYNVWIRDGVGTGLGAPFRGQAQDDDPTSMTWVGGPYGEVPDYQSSSLYANQAAAQADAQAAKLRARGRVETVSITAIPKPDTDVDDVVSASRIRAGIAPNSLYVVDSFIIGLGSSGLLTATVRAVL
jgi:Domain of unknown function (DUF5047)